MRDTRRFSWRGSTTSLATALNRPPGHLVAVVRAL